MIGGLRTLGQQTPQTFVQETHYLLSLPEGYEADSSKKWPLVIFLHGSGESGNDLEKVKLHGPPQLVEQGKKFPFILVSPQAPPQTGWPPETVFRLLQHIKQTQRVDPQKVYLTGLSMGGYGTWALAIEHPEEFAAIAPVCGGGDSSKAWKLRNIPIWCFHGAKDDVVPPGNSERMVKAASRLNNAVKFTLYPEANHNSWDLTYNNDSLYTWLLAQTKFSYKEVAISSSILQQYTGTYVNGTDTVGIAIENNGLVAIFGRQRIALKAASENQFFIQPTVPVDLSFTRNKKMVEGFWLMENERRLFKKVK